MFSKLLKYDTKSVFKYWWIGAVASLLIAVFGGVCIQIVDIDYTSYEIIPILGGIGLVFSLIGMYLLPILTEILVLVRFYKHFFTDEGYLTFTLPVKRTSLLDSKIATYLIFGVSTIFVMIADVLTMLAIGIPEEFFSGRFWTYIGELFSEIYEALGIYGAPYTVLAVLIMLATVISSTLLVYVCITLASAITKRHKILLSIGIYYGVSMVVSGLVQIFMYGGVSTVITMVTGLDEALAKAAIMFMMIGVLGLLTVFIAALYFVELYLLDKRLNLE
ncbi:MAG: hypothetical protein IJC86_02470 [Clostridia bacterium]|nr:hypothetical protein [Clostridia bacterium]